MQEHVFLKSCKIMYMILFILYILVFLSCYKIGLINFMSNSNNSMKSLIDTFMFKLVVFFPPLITFIAEFICINSTIASFKRIFNRESIIKALINSLWKIFIITSFNLVMMIFMCTNTLSTSNNISIYIIIAFVNILFSEIIIISAQIEILDGFKRSYIYRNNYERNTLKHLKYEYYKPYKY